MFNTSLELKIADFGVAFNFEDEPNDFVDSDTGTRLYHPPEMYNRDKSIHPKYSATKCDIWAIGCLLYEMLVGRHPIETDNQVKNFYEKIKES